MFPLMLYVGFDVFKSLCCLIILHMNYPMNHDLMRNATMKLVIRLLISRGEA